MKHLQYLFNGLIKQNPTLVLLLGTCPTLAVTTSAINGVGMGFSTLFVLVCSNIVISLIQKIVPKSVRIPCYIVVISAFVTILGLLVQTYLPDINSALGIYLPLIVVNCIVLGRAEMFASKHGVLDSMLDGIGMGLGFTLALICMGSVREFFSQGSLFGFAILPEGADTMAFFGTPAGGFFVFGCLIALVTAVTKGKAPVKKSFDCEGCPSASLCHASYKCIEIEPAAVPAPETVDAAALEGKEEQNK